MVCKGCKHYHRGEGDKHCLSCEKIKKHMEIKKKKDPPIVYVSPDVLDGFVTDSRTTEIYDQLQILPPKEATIFLQYYLLSMSCRDIAEFWGVSVSTVWRVIERVREFLKGK